MLLPELWSLIGSYATSAEQPIWALATKDSDKDYQFNQKWLESLPMLPVFAAAEGDMESLKMAESMPAPITQNKTWGAAFQAAKEQGQKTEMALKVVIRKMAREAAKGNHIDILKWIKQRGLLFSGIVDISRVWISGAAHPQVREWAMQMELESVPENKMTPEERVEYLEHFFEHVRENAAKSGNLSVIKILHQEEIYKNTKISNAHIKFGLDYKTLGTINENGVAMLSDLVINEHAEVAAWCLDTWPNLGAEAGTELIAHATRFNRIEIVEDLLRRGYRAPADICDEDAVHYDCKLLRIFVEQGYRITAETYSNAARSCGHETLKWLEEQKCAVDQRRAMSAAIKSSNYPVVRHLIKRRGYRTIVANRGDNTYHIHSAGYDVCDLGDTSMIRLLHECGVPIAKATDAMWLLARNNHINAMKLLRELGAPMTADACNSALGLKRYLAYAWLMAAGCPTDYTTEEMLDKCPPFVRATGLAAAKTATGSLPITIPMLARSLSSAMNVELPANKTSRQDGEYCEYCGFLENACICRYNY